MIDRMNRCQLTNSPFPWGPRAHASHRNQSLPQRNEPKAITSKFVALGIES